MAAIAVAAVGVFVLWEIFRWTGLAFRSFATESDVLTACLWIACFGTALAGTAGAVWLYRQASPWSRAQALALAVIGLVLSLVGAFAYWLDAIMAAQAIFYHARGGQQTLARSRIGLTVCAATFITSVMGLLRAATRRSA